LPLNEKDSRKNIIFGFDEPWKKKNSSNKTVFFIQINKMNDIVKKYTTYVGILKMA